MLDDSTLRLVNAGVTVLLTVLFLSAYHATRSRLSLYWTFALLCQVGSAGLTAFVGAEAGLIVAPLANGLSIMGLMFAWGGARSLRGRSLPVWLLAAPPVGVALVTVAQEVLQAPLPGVLVRDLAATGILSLSTWDVVKADPRHRRVKRPLLIASVVLTLFFAARSADLALLGPASPLFQSVLSDNVEIVVILLALVMVSFSIAALSHSDAEDRLRSTAKVAAIELSQGALVQQALFPNHRLEGVQFPVSGACVPSRSLSGDFFDWTADSERLIITVGDVMGKGVGAAMLGATVRAGLRVARRRDPGADVAAVTEAVGEDLVRNGSYVTLFHAYLERATSRLTVLDAGHGLALIVRRDGTKEQIRSVNLPLGLNRGAGWIVRTYTLEPGDRLLVFSDGVLDLFDGTLDSLERAADIALASDVRNMDDAVDRIRELADSGAHLDDVTVVALERPLVGSRQSAAR